MLGKTLPSWTDFCHTAVVAIVSKDESNDHQITLLAMPNADRVFLPWLYHERRLFSAKFQSGLQSVVFF